MTRPGLQSGPGSNQLTGWRKTATLLVATVPSQTLEHSLTCMWGVGRSMNQKICNETDGCYDHDPFLSLAFLSLSMRAGPITPRMFVKICLAFCLQGVQGSRVCSLCHLPIYCPFLSAPSPSARRRGPGPPISCPSPNPGEEKTVPTSSSWLPGEQQSLKPTQESRED